MATPDDILPHLGELRHLLVEARRTTEARIAALERDFGSIVEATRETATDDEHDPEGSTIAYERAQVQTLAAEAHEQLAEIAAAEQRFADDDFGRCETCGEAIALVRLQARPMARTCIRCASERR
ncbi:TraR/DksA C4-type zinc finger protein [Brevibacterium sp.]|uniref:TraR/DksA family transcriptional regulator n=1 Tax=Brevibacterium sp. TaxID=1701 RepID=UPI0028118656|nr:TraR/DksA C4-type zinc finger protein [Brevibacterium sp.]